MRRRRAVALAGALVALGGFGGAMAWRTRHSDDLLARAAQVADTSGWGRGQPFNLSIGVHWLSDEDVLFDRFEGPKGDPRVCYRRNLRTGVEWKLDGLSAVCRALNPQLTDSAAVSPDGKWLLWPHSNDAVLLAEVNGARRHTYHSRYGLVDLAVAWFPDGHRWLENTVMDPQGGSVVLHDVRHPAVRQPLALGALAPSYAELQAIRPDNVGVCVTWPDPVSGTDTRPPTLTVRTVRLGSPGTLLSTSRIPVPRGDLDPTVLVSPAGDRLALEVHVPPHDPMPAWMRRLLPFVRLPQERRTALWVCRLDGSDMHELGAVTEADHPGDDDAGVRAIWLDPQWLPSGKALSFEYHDALYTVPAS